MITHIFKLTGENWQFYRVIFLKPLYIDSRMNRWAKEKHIRWDSKKVQWVMMSYNEPGDKRGKSEKEFGKKNCIV